MNFVKKLPRSVIWYVGSPQKNSPFPECRWRTAQGQKLWRWEQCLQTPSRWKAEVIAPHNLKTPAPQSCIWISSPSSTFLLQARLSTWQYMNHSVSSRLMTHIHPAHFLQKKFKTISEGWEIFTFWKCICNCSSIQWRFHAVHFSTCCYTQIPDNLME